MATLSVNDFAKAFGVNPEMLSKNLVSKINNFNFNFDVIEGEEYQQLVLQILKSIDADKQIIGAKERTQVWYDGWKENLDEFVQSDYDESKLKPKFIKDRKIVRLNQQYVRTEDENFELNFVEIYRDFFIETYFSSIDNVYEFGCGTGFNLLAVKNIFPNINLFGSDFVQTSVDLVNAIGRSRKINLRGHIFDMLKPDYSYKIKDNSGIFTFGSLEQLAGKVDDIIEYFIAMKPKICIHTEPSMELYDDNNLNDYLAKKFHNKRGYTIGFLSRLEDLEKQGKIKILKIKRSYFGSMYLEAYNLIVWKLVA